MTTLAEIQKAASELPAAKRTELVLSLVESLRHDGAALPEPRRFSEEQLQKWLEEDDAAMRRFRASR
jgi:hypothetical protein